MTRLTEDDVRGLAARLPEFDTGLLGVAGVDLRRLALRTCDLDEAASPLAGARMAAVPVSSGLGFIPFFSQCIEVILRHLGCDAFVTAQPDVKGLQEAADRDAQVIFIADDDRFVALNVRNGACADDDPCTANGYVVALEAAAGGLSGRPVLVLGLGPVGRAASRRLAQRGARVLAAEPDGARAASAAADYGVSIVSLEEGLTATGLIFDATPIANLVDADHITAGSIAAVPAVPSGFTAAARAALGARHIHEPLAVGVAVMAVEALSGRVSPRA
jgi:3-methylornithyl-N6-L-lysine dehydrogenase